ncbi:ABC transporter ATP-binding protein [Halostella pelagica]|uniref:ABC transporter ATP-binding protein n=1 Tax=Halostella pelagica TaxID=2583824 RepID=UPI0010815FBB|nr:ABC transporter ATP-binding protein [Halostella pelagica]
MATSPLVELNSVRKEFDSLVAVDGVDLQIQSGEFFSLLGPSGCGKTTCLRMISGFERPTEGEVLFEGTDVTDVPPNRRDTNMVFQHLSLFPHMTVGENIQYGLKKSGVPDEECAERVSTYLDLVDLPGSEDRDPTALSGGQQQRVALARSLVNKPSVLLLDEPLSGLDRKLRQHMQIELAKIQREVEGSFFYVTHDQEVAMTLSDRLAIMREGEIEQVGTPEDVYHNPASPFVADFIGDTNLLAGEATDVAEGTRIELEGAGGPVWTTTRSDVEGDVTLSVRPESVRLDAGERGLFEAEVVDRFFQGDHVEYMVSPTTDPTFELDVTAYDTEETYEEGKTVSVSIDESGVTIFE